MSQTSQSEEPDLTESPEGKKEAVFKQEEITGRTEVAQRCDDRVRRERKRKANAVEEEGGTRHVRGSEEGVSHNQSWRKHAAGLEGRDVCEQTGCCVSATRGRGRRPRCTTNSDASK